MQLGFFSKTSEALGFHFAPKESCCQKNRFSESDLTEKLLTSLRNQVGTAVLT